MIDKKIEAYSDTTSKYVEGRCALVYDDAIASGTNEYVPMTYILLEDENGDMHVVKPRNIKRVIS